jgi:hypothetical protein
MSSTSSIVSRQDATQDVIAAINAAQDAAVALRVSIDRRELFLAGSMAFELSVDREHKLRLQGEIESWCRGRMLTDDEMLTLYGEPLRLGPIRGIDPDAKLSIYEVVWTPSACRHFLEQCPEERAPRFLRAWFGNDPQVTGANTCDDDKVNAQQKRTPGPNREPSLATVSVTVLCIPNLRL